MNPSKKENAKKSCRQNDDMAEWKGRTAKMRLGGKEYPRLLLMRAPEADAIMCLLGWQKSRLPLGTGFPSTFWLSTLTQPLDDMLHNGLCLTPA